MIMRKFFSGVLVLGLLAPMFLTVNSKPALARSSFSNGAGIAGDKTKDGGGTPRPTPPPGPPK